ncbi:MAG TPA: tRNA lysidine(34) synthetase TilS [Dongiaceae bacterium]|nr:tRNA lysidine(34) synthetase TilS [Dongiaceae bacterium]
MHRLIEAATSRPEGVSAEHFARLLARLGPFEPRPAIAVAVSGGSDSMALALLLDEWAIHRDARIEAITVDHGLRPDSGAEAGQVGRWLAGRRATRHTILRWTEAKPETGIQAAARAARYRLMTEHCRAEGILHLCLAHHLDDQIETRAMRAARQSGPAGLAGMSAVREAAGVRLLRPLLGITKQALRATLAARRQDWIEDPSNRNPAFERARLREGTPGQDPRDAVPTLHRAGLERRRLESDAAARLCADLTIHDTGWASLDPAALLDGEPASALAFAGLLQAIGGTDYPIAPERRLEALARLRELGPAGFTLGGCYLSVKAGHLEICRDWGAIGEETPIHPGMRLLWDRRFAVEIPQALDGRVDLTIARLGERGIRSLGRDPEKPESGTGDAIPISARKALPALWQGDRLLAVPHLGFGPAVMVRFRPVNPATSSGFTVAY